MCATYSKINKASFEGQFYQQNTACGDEIIMSIQALSVMCSHSADALDSGDPAESGEGFGRILYKTQGGNSGRRGWVKVAALDNACVCMAKLFICSLHRG